VKHDISLALVVVGTVVVVWSSVASLLLLGGSGLRRLHLLSPVTSLGAPLVGAGLCVEEGWGLTTGEIILVVGLLVVSGPALTAALGRLVAQHEGLVAKSDPD
jgi:multisubunit Na+/H+ antiporter MnhG subunit